ncbi:hypothetical protein [Lysobacter sp. CA199]|uniref:hypothetical protein n=1 Tax=Lysobacter sp. CA199 TaxID=3455608 RepID=UPI003F8D8B09
MELRDELLDLLRWLDTAPATTKFVEIVDRRRELCEELVSLGLARETTGGGKFSLTEAGTTAARRRP